MTSRVLWPLENTGRWVTIWNTGGIPKTTISATRPSSAVTTRSRVGRISATIASISGSAPA